MPDYLDQPEINPNAPLEEELGNIIKIIQEYKMPEWWMQYAGQLAYNLQVHTKGLMFDKVTGLFPNEHPESQKHCVNSYEAITKGSIWKAINNIIRVFSNSSYEIKISDKVKAIIAEYEDKEGSFFSQFMEDWIRYAIATDPNGLCVTYPRDYTDDLYRYVCYKDIKYISDELIIFTSELESEKKIEFVTETFGKEFFYDWENLDGQPNFRHVVTRTFNRRLELRYLNEVYHAFTKTHFIRIFKTDPGQTEYEYEFIRFGKELPTLPYFESGGVELENNLYESFVQRFVPFGNLALMAHRNQRAVDLMFSYPRMSEVQTNCDTCDGTGFLDKACTQVCHTCKGSKFTTTQSPYKVYRKVADSFDVDGKVFSTPSVEFYTPDVGIIDYNNKNWKDCLSLAEEAVFIQQKVETGNVQAAKSKEIDREGLYAWLCDIAKVLFNNLQMFLQNLENYESGNPMSVSVEKPYSFAILTESEAFDALSAILSSNAPVAIKANQIDNFINKFISDSSPVKRALHILKKFDLLLYYSNSDVQNLKGQGAISSKMLQQHALAYPILIQLYELDPKLFDSEDGVIIGRLTTEIQKFDLTTDLRTSILNQNGIPQ